MDEFYMRVKELNNTKDNAIDHAIRDRPRKIGVGINIMQKASALFNFSKDDKLKIRERDGLKYADSWIKMKTDEYNRFMSGLEKQHESVLKDFDIAIKEKTEQIRELRKEIKEIQAKIEKTDDEIARKKLKSRLNLMTRESLKKIPRHSLVKGKFYCDICKKFILDENKNSLDNHYEIHFQASK